MHGALYKKPDILLADEPTGNLDDQSAHDVLNTLKRLHEMGSIQITLNALVLFVLLISTQLLFSISEKSTHYQMQQNISL